MLTRILGLDLSLTSSGWCYDDRAYGTIQPKLKSPITRQDQIRRLQTIRENIQRTIVDYGVPDRILIEDYAFSSKNPGHYTGELGGVIRLYLFEHGFIPGQNLYFPSPTQLKKFVTGKGNADKSQMRLSVYKQWGFEDQSDDVIDAFALVKLGEALTATTLKPHQLDVVLKLKGDR